MWIGTHTEFVCVRACVKYPSCLPFIKLKTEYTEEDRIFSNEKTFPHPFPTFASVRSFLPNFIQTDKIKCSCTNAKCYERPKIQTVVFICEAEVGVLCSGWSKPLGSHFVCFLFAVFMTNKQEWILICKTTNKCLGKYVYLENIITGTQNDERALQNS